MSSATPTIPTSPQRQSADEDAPAPTNPAVRAQSDPRELDGDNNSSTADISQSQSSPQSDSASECSELEPSSPPQPQTAEATDAVQDTEAAAGVPPLPAEPLPVVPVDDGWDPHWVENDWWFYNRFTGVWQKENPRVPDAAAVQAAAAAPPLPQAEKVTVLSNPESIAGGYNPAIHGDYDENAWYAKKARADEAAAAASSQLAISGAAVADPALYLASVAAAGGAPIATAAYFNRQTGQWQQPEFGPERHTDEAKSKRQMSAYFDVDAAANMHDGRSLKAERSGKKPTKAELKAFKEKRRVKKEEKRRAWLRD
ncbi:hypothetical protein B0T24DRAFT_185754 [Lasiosphaeria ovina]|uniref:WW domain-containing protein n=1 Tax=Lasiosphaeria ovina TaxID=92902 RepID=A0AAE0NEV5_9PEZI|nr:hypothetical protein B0T24DRAFT_185754 [Lasiosphaeria ovina]